jgi:16S rRNA A1518/A1519 N6-dimethyltransferase RsmA/KsgA/DIM1 with predicted DNA glycosylase/AP lyase activity
VLSTVVRVTFRPCPIRIDDPDFFTRMVRTVFTQRRKTLSNALKPFAETHGASATAALARAGLDGRCRPETLQLVDLAGLADALAFERRA